MKIPSVYLTKNLRKSILQGDPWIYNQAISLSQEIKEACLCKVFDQRKDFLCWGMYCPNSQLAVRVLSLRKQQPTAEYYESLLLKAVELRKSIYSDQTNSYRLLNGEGDLLPGIVCDIYANVAVIQFDGPNPYAFWDQDWLAEWILEHTYCTTVYYKPRHDQKSQSKSWGAPLPELTIETIENDVKFFVDIQDGQKTGFFIDQRDNRNFVKQLSKNKTVLNLFSYTGGFSVYAGLGGAHNVTSVDISDGALALAHRNWSLNELSPAIHETKSADVFEYLHHETKLFDIVICDPPSLAKAEKNKEQAVQKYIETFAASAKLVSNDGYLVLSSCSSHVNFEEFNDIVNGALSKARKRAQIIRVSGQGSDHPYPHACPHLRYLKFIALNIY